jgi:CheY-like chemotaxis protein
MFHGILIDNSMPVMNGIVAVRHIRDAGYTGRIFGVTGNGFQSDIDDFLMHGADEVLVKPVGMEGYAHIIATLH